MSTNVRESLQKINIRGEILYDQPLSQRTTLHIGGNADAVVVPENPLELISLIPYLIEKQIPYAALGSGSNLLASDEGFPGCMIDLKHCTHHSFRGRYLFSEAGIKLESLIHSAAELELSGLEHLTGIPGTLGGAIACNAGAFGRDIASVLEWVDFLDDQGTLRRLHAREAAFSYRRAPFTRRNIILEAGLRLDVGRSTEILSSMNRSKQERKRRGYYGHPSAGSVFKNPPGLEITAGELSQQVGLKGVSIGGAQVSPQHGNIIINTGNATSDDVRKLIDFMKQKIEEETGIQLEEEIRALV